MIINSTLLHGGGRIQFNSDQVIICEGADGLAVVYYSRHIIPLKTKYTTLAATINKGKTNEQTHLVSNPST